jgi:hypothetical protein
MKKLAALVFVSSLGCAGFLHGAEQAVITISNDIPDARPGTVVVVPFAEIRAALPGVLMHHLAVKNAATGALVPVQVTNFNPDDRRALYDDLVFQHDFAAGEKTAKFILEKTEKPLPPFETKVAARYVPERLDDFAWENDRIGHRIYGPQLTTAAAGPGTRMISSGIDVWCKRVRYPIVDRWYNKGHDAYHTDTGEGMDLYSVGTARGCGGTGIWDGQTLHVSRNWQTQKVLANGPIRAVFELGYDTWQAGPRWVTETKRFTVDAGRNLDQIDSTFAVKGDAEVVVAIGIAKPTDAKVLNVTRSETGRSITVWQQYERQGASLGCGIVLSPDATFAGFAEDAANYLILAKVKSGVPVRYYAGAGWDRGGDFADAAAWDAYIARFARDLTSPVKATVSKP